ncbi:MAG: TetR/AcrR family transcriptional regulator [Acidimicrobiales bacterium]
MTERLSVDVPESHTGPIEIEIRRGGATIATLALEPGALVETGASKIEEPTAASEGREQQILEIAGDVISTKGFAATSIRDIAKAADISIAALYRHIGSKDELLFRITQARMQELFDHFDANLTSGGTPSERLADAIAVYVAYISKNHRYINLVYRETKALDEQARSRIYETERRFMKLWEQIIGDGVASGEFVDVDVNLAANLSYFACTVWALRYWSIGDRTEADVRDLLTTLIVGGLTPR